MVLELESLKSPPSGLRDAVRKPGHRVEVTALAVLNRKFYRERSEGWVIGIGVTYPMARSD